MASHKHSLNLSLPPPPTDPAAALAVYIGDIARETALVSRIVAMRMSSDDRGMRDSLETIMDKIAARLDDASGMLAAVDAWAAERAFEGLRERRSRQAGVKALFEEVKRVQEGIPADVADKLRAEGGAVVEDEVEAVEEDVRRAVPGHGGGNVRRGTGRKPLEARNVANGIEVPRTKVVVPAKPITGVQSKQKAKPKNKPRPPPVQEEEEREEGGGSGMPTIENITAEELAAAPAYVKGRLTVERTGRVVFSLNRVLTAKYTFLARSPRNLSGADVSRRHDMQTVEDELEDAICGRAFFTDADMKLEGVGLDSMTKSVLNLLRHVLSLKEVRSKTKVRVFILSR